MKTVLYVIFVSLKRVTWTHVVYPHFSAEISRRYTVLDNYLLSFQVLFGQAVVYAVKCVSRGVNHKFHHNCTLDCWTGWRSHVWQSHSKERKMILDSVRQLNDKWSIPLMTLNYKRPPDNTYWQEPHVMMPD